VKQKRLNDIEFNCNNGLRADRVNYKILKSLREINFKYLAFGVESGNNKILKNLKKGETIEQNETAIRDSLRLGFKVTLFFLVGSPGETVNDVHDSFKFALRYPVFDTRFYNIVPFPATELYNWAKSNDYLLSDSDYYLNHFSHWDNVPIFATPELSEKQRKQLLMKARRIRKKFDTNQ